jgi:TolB protein
MRRRIRRSGTALALAVVTALVGPGPTPPVHAAFPGSNGRIAFVSGRHREGLLAFGHIYTVAPDGSGVAMITDADAWDWGPHWSPAGDRIVFSRRSEFVPFTHKRWIYTIGSNGSDLVQVGHRDSADPSFSPDGTQIVFVKGFGIFAEIQVRDVDGTGGRRLTSDFVEQSEPVWSPDGTMIAFVQEAGDLETPQVWVMDADGSKARRLTVNRSQKADIEWSPDSSLLAYTVYSNSGATIGIVGADGSNQHLVLDDGVQSSEPAFSPDGAKIAFSRFLPEVGNSDIYVMNIDGTGLVRITSRLSSDESPDWQPTSP